MYDYGLSTLTQYQLTVRTTARIRGALLCRTDRGDYIIREFKGSERKLKKQQELLLKMRDAGCMVDVYVQNEEGELISYDRDGIPYTLQLWLEGRECDPRSKEEILMAVRTLAVIHEEMHLPLEPDYVETDLSEEYRRHNQELRKIRKFIRKKGPSSVFEKEYLNVVEWFLERAEQAEQMLEKSFYRELYREALNKGSICHGEYNQHNVRILKNEAGVTGFSHWCFGIQAGDLYRFMRKILEKYNWNQGLSEEMLKAYCGISALSKEEKEYLKIRFSYPDKFWKISNYYYTHNKAWISEKNTEKLKMLICQREKWDRFCKECFR